MFIKLTPIFLVAVVAISVVPAHAQAHTMGSPAHGMVGGNPMAGSSNTGVGPSGATAPGFGAVAGATGPGATNPGSVAPAASAAPGASAAGHGAMRGPTTNPVK